MRDGPCFVPRAAKIRGGRTASSVRSGSIRHRRVEDLLRFELLALAALDRANEPDTALGARRAPVPHLKETLRTPVATWTSTE